MGDYLLHKNEWWVAFLLFLLSLSCRLDKAIRSERRKNQGDDTMYKHAHQSELVKEWVTSQYCKADLEILCPSRAPINRCQEPFDPPLRWVLDLPGNAYGTDSPSGCALKGLLSHVKWTEQESIEELEDDEQLTYFIAYVLGQIRNKSTVRFRADDRSVLEFEQSRLVEATLMSILHLFASSTKGDEQGTTESTKAVNYGITKRVWSRAEVISLMHEACLWHTHHKRHGSSSVAGAALRLSRQQPSFVFKYLPIVKEEIHALESDPESEAKFRIQYPSTTFGSETISLAQNDNPHAYRCLWSHFYQGTLISQDCTLALETAPGKIRELDWEGKYLLLLVRIYNFFSAAFALWAWARLRHNHRDVLKRRKSDLIEITPTGVEVVSSTVILQMDSAADSQYGETRIERIRKTKRLCFVHVTVSCIVGFVSSTASDTVQFADFLDGICIVLLGLVSLNHPTLVPQANPGCSIDMEKRQRQLHYKKLASLDIT
jgi:hypothetical protein